MEVELLGITVVVLSSVELETVVLVFVEFKPVEAEVLVDPGCVMILEFPNEVVERLEVLGRLVVVKFDDDVVVKPLDADVDSGIEILLEFPVVVMAVEIVDVVALVEKPVVEVSEVDVSSGSVIRLELLDVTLDEVSVVVRLDTVVAEELEDNDVVVAGSDSKVELLEVEFKESVMVVVVVTLTVVVEEKVVVGSDDDVVVVSGSVIRLELLGAVDAVAAVDEVVEGKLRVDESDDEVDLVADSDVRLEEAKVEEGGLEVVVVVFAVVVVDDVDVDSGSETRLEVLEAEPVDETVAAAVVVVVLAAVIVEKEPVEELYRDEVEVDAGSDMTLELPLPEVEVDETVAPVVAEEVRVEGLDAEDVDVAPGSDRTLELLERPLTVDGLVVWLEPLVADVEDVSVSGRLTTLDEGPPVVVVAPVVEIDEFVVIKEELLFKHID
ncbi:hypothetical protein TWF696_008054 [Orbilia brochopaga]|uniref:Uncharacterized protein n=1 Tax=Orbilia brochopaga TaxID=3140254 RepID=A0AAV9UQR5_9PEZI